MQIIGVPFNAGALEKQKGIEKAPDAILKYLDKFYLKETGILPIYTYKKLNIDNFNITHSHQSIEKYVKESMMRELLLGGDHSLTYSAFSAFSKKHSNPGLLIFDAHLDCMDNFSPPTHEDFVRVLIEEGKLKSTNIIFVGTRNFHIKEFEYAKGKRLKYFGMTEIAREGVNEIADAIMSVCKNFDGLYISVDIDVLDPSFAPGTGYLEPGGLTTRQLLSFIQRLKNLKNIGMWDIVEVNPEKDVSDLTVITAAKLIVEIS